VKGIVRARDHIDQLVKLLVLRHFYQIKYEILKFIEPEKEFEYNIRILTDWRLGVYFIEGYFFDVVRDDEEYRENALIVIKNVISRIENSAFQPFTYLIPKNP